MLTLGQRIGRSRPDQMPISALDHIGRMDQHRQCGFDIEQDLATLRFIAPGRLALQRIQTCAARLPAIEPRPCDLQLRAGHRHGVGIAFDADAEFGLDRTQRAGLERALACHGVDRCSTRPQLGASGQRTRLPVGQGGLGQ